MNLRSYQRDGIEAIRAAFRRGRKSVGFIGPCGMGKTVILSSIARGATAKSNRMTIVVHRQELIRQTAQALEKTGVPFGLIAAGTPADSGPPVQLAMVQTLANRLDSIPDPHLIIVDEFHHAVSPTYRAILDRYRAAKVLGLTATPQRLDGKGLSAVCEELVMGPSVQALIDQGFLCEPVYFAPPTGVSMDGVKKSAGDFNKKQMAFRVDTPQITGSAVEHYARICPGKSAIAFCISLKHAENVCAQFNAAGYPAGLIDGRLSDKDREDRVAALTDGRILVLVSVDVVSEGFDLPSVEVGIMLRPTESLALAMQQMGRILRPSPGKNRAIILDHVGNILRHGLAETPREWSLEGHAEADKRAAAERNFLVACPECFTVQPSAPLCVKCAFVFPASERKVKEVVGTLEEITAERVAAEQARIAARVQVGRAQTREELEAIAKARGYKPAWVKMMLWKRRAAGSASQKKPAAPDPQRSLFA